MYDTPIARITGCLSSIKIKVGHSLELACTRVNRVMLVCLCTETIKKLVLRGTKYDGCGMHQCITYILQLIGLSITGVGREGDG